MFCGRLVDFKRPETALFAFRSALAEDPAARLIFLGSGPLEKELRQQAADSGLADRTIFLGFRSNPYPVMAACQYGLVTSSQEGFPNVVLDMMACGLRTIVMTPCAGDLDQLHGVTITRTHDVQDVADSLKAAVTSDEVHSDQYRAVARSRSVASYLDQVLAT